LRILTNRVTSPTLLGQLSSVLKSFPEAKWYRCEPVDDDAERGGAAQAFGRPLTGLARLRDARVVLALDADPIGFGPEQIRLSREFAAARQTSSPADFLRLYVVEPAFTLSGANADHRLALDHAMIRNLALAVAADLGASLEMPPLPHAAQRFARAVAADLKSRPGQAMVMAGRRQPAEVHALCHWINQRLDAPIDFIAPIDPATSDHGESPRALAGDIAEGKVQTLIVLADNPVYDAPGELKLGEAIASVPFRAHLALYDNETSARCKWHLPLSHPLESWSDLRAYDGTYTPHGGSTSALRAAASLPMRPGARRCARSLAVRRFPPRLLLHGLPGVRALSRSPDVLDAAGGTDIFQMAAGRVKLTAGTDSVRCHTYPARFCAGTPIAAGLRSPTPPPVRASRSLRSFIPL
jgi:molybdopterin-containing oxidoreductase family iron-sulfur binding subunit